MENITEKYKEECEEILNLTPGWDGPNSTSYEKDTLDSALIFLSKILQETKSKTDIQLPLPNLYPGAFGGVQFEFDDDKYYLHILLRKSENNTIEIVGRSQIDPELKYYEEIQNSNINDTFFEWITEIMNIEFQ